MYGIEVRNQRPLWIASSALFLTGVIVTLVLASSARENAEVSAAASAQRAVQETLVPELTPSDLAQQVTGPRLDALDAFVTKRLLSAGPTDVVRLLSPDSTVVFSTDRADVGTRETSERDRITRVIEQGRESVVGSSAFRVFVPLRLEAGGPVLGIAELQQRYEPLWAAASRPWRIGTIVCALLCLGSLALLVLTFRGRGARPHRVVTALPSATVDAPSSASGEEELETARARAERAERITEQTSRRLATVQTELDRVRKQAISAEQADPADAADTDTQILELHSRLGLVEAERDAAKERLDRALADAQARAAEPGGSDASDPSTARSPQVATLERELARTEAARSELERHAIDLERRVADATASRAEAQRMLAAADRTENADQLAAQAAQADAARVAAERRAAQAEQRAIMAEGRSATAELGLNEAVDRAGTAEQELSDLREQMLVAEQDRSDATRARGDDLGPGDDTELRDLRERLHHSADQLGLMQERARAAERELGAATERIEELESTQRREKLQDALLHLRADGHADVPLEDRRAAAPFVQQLSLDARTSLAAIRGLLLTMDGHQDADSAALVDKLSAHARKLEQVVGDLLDADRLARGDIDLSYRDTDLADLVQRVVEETGIDAENHPIQVHAEAVTLSVDPIRVEEIVSGLLTGAVERDQVHGTIAVRVERAEGGALISVEDDQPSSDASMSPVVARFADVHGGWAIVEGRQGGGSAFRVFLPDHAADAAPEAEGDDVTIMLPDPSHHGLPAS